ncbi:TPA: hypothetical protein BOS_9948 [Bos taurus]|nr:TPA: hypothetical protein BOS_9948 [Bos taurus]
MPKYYLGVDEGGGSGRVYRSQTHRFENVTRVDDQETRTGTTSSSAAFHKLTTCPLTSSNSPAAGNTKSLSDAGTFPPRSTRTTERRVRRRGASRAARAEPPRGSPGRGPTTGAAPARARGLRRYLGRGRRGAEGGGASGRRAPRAGGAHGGRGPAARSNRQSREPAVRAGASPRATVVPCSTITTHVSNFQ